MGAVWAMGAPAYFDRLLDRCRTTFAHQQRPDWVTLCEQSGMKMDAQSGAVVFEEEAIGHGLYGDWWERPVPWRQMERDLEALWEFPPKNRYLVVEACRPKTAYPLKSSVSR